MIAIAVSRILAFDGGWGWGRGGKGTETELNTGVLQKDQKHING